MRSGKTPRKREPKYEQNSAELNPSTGRGVCGEVCTWTAVMQLAEEGKLDLNADVETCLDLKIQDTRPEPITMKYLMTHTAGFEEQFAAQLAEDEEDVVPLREFLLRHMPERVYPQGEIYTYSNYGTAPAGYIVERVSGNRTSGT